MNKLILLALMFLSGCTIIHAELPDGRIYDYRSTKEFDKIKIIYEKNQGGISVSVEVDGVQEDMSGKIAEGIGKGIVKGTTGR